MDLTQPQRFYGLDHLRTLAILLVFIFHYDILTGGEPGWLHGFAIFGWTGVDLFFVLSGFLISSELFRQIKNARRISYRDFFLKRFFRIIPAYLLIVAIYFCIPYFREKESLPPLWKFLTFTQNFGLDPRHSGTFSHAWSLCVEEHFYFFLPITLIVLQATGWVKNAAWILLILFLAGLGLRIYSFNALYLPTLEDGDSGVAWSRYLYYPTYVRLDGLLAGVSIGALYNFLPAVWEKIAKWGNWLIVIALIIFGSSAVFLGDQQSFTTSVFGFTTVAIGYSFLVMAALSPSCFLYKWRSKTSTRIAIISYAIYLSHKGVIHITHEVLSEFDLNSTLLMLISMVTCTVAAIGIYLCLEKPFLRLSKNIRLRLANRDKHP